MYICTNKNYILVRILPTLINLQRTLLKHYTNILRAKVLKLNKWRN